MQHGWISTFQVINHLHHCHVVTLNQNMHMFPSLSPQCYCQYNGKHLHCCLQPYSIPWTLQPLSLPNCSTPPWPRCIWRKDNVGIHNGLWTSIIEQPFHFDKKTIHHSTSERNSAFRFTQWWRYQTVYAPLIIRLRNILPEFTTFGAWLNFPIRERRSCCLHFLRDLHSTNITWICATLSSGSLISILVVSSRIPRKNEVDEGKDLQFFLFSMERQASYVTPWLMTNFSRILVKLLFPWWESHPNNYVIGKHLAAEIPTPMRLLQL